MQTTITWPHFPNEKIKPHKGLKIGPSHKRLIRGGIGTRILISWYFPHDPTHDSTTFFSTNEGVFPAVSAQGALGSYRAHMKGHVKPGQVFIHRRRAQASPGQVYMSFSNLTLPLSPVRFFYCSHTPFCHAPHSSPSRLRLLLILPHKMPFASLCCCLCPIEFYVPTKASFISSFSWT